MQEAKRGTVNMLYDSGSTISLINLSSIKDEALIYEKQIALTGITGHKINTLGKMRATIQLGENKIKHTFYVI